MDDFSYETKMGKTKTIFAVSRKAYGSDDKVDTEFFSGFLNRTTKKLDEYDQEQHWGVAEWMENVEDAYFFNSLSEAALYAKDLAQYDSSREYTVVLYGWNDTEDLSGSNWYPLREFAGAVINGAD